MTCSCTESNRPLQSATTSDSELVLIAAGDAANRSASPRGRPIFQSAPRILQNFPSLLPRQELIHPIRIPLPQLVASIPATQVENQRSGQTELNKQTLLSFINRRIPAEKA